MVLRPVRALAAVVLAAGMALAAPAAAMAVPVDPGSVDRLQGGDRYATAVEVSQALVPKPSGFGVAYVASGADFPDALAAGPATQGWGQPTPLLLVPRSGALPAAVAAELERLQLSQIYVVGGSAAVDDTVYSQLRGYAQDIQRLNGNDRYETAALVGEIAAGNGGTFVLATGLDYPDALTGAALAARVDGGLLLTRPDRLPEATESALTYWKPAKVVVLGGPGVVSDAVLGRVQQVTGLQPQRLFGDDRYATAARASQYTYAGGASHALVATGANFPDALAGGPLSAVTGEPLLLVRQQCAPAAAVTEASRLGVSAVTALGGAGVVSDGAAQLHSCG